MKMNFSTGTWYSRARGKSPGWAAFDLKQRQGALTPETEGEPFPPISRTPVSALPSNSQLRIPDKPFSSFFPSSDEFPSLADERISDKQFHTGNSMKPQESCGNSRESVAREVQKLKELHTWADEDLILDIYKALGNNFSKTSSLLEGMVFDWLVEAKEKDVGPKIMARNHFTGISSSNGRMTDVGFPSRIHVNPGNQNATQVLFGVRADKNDVKFDCDDVNGSITERTISLPTEPEWEEEDVYLRSRRDALRAMRSASQHSRAASNAFLRGDHSAAQHHSSKAHDQWVVAENLNNEAAKDIISLRNSNNDIWTLDLHGLHKTEALHALSERLRTIEYTVPTNRSVSPDRDKRVHKTNGVVRSSSAECLACPQTENLDKPLASGQRSAKLHVITGIGKHSKEQATLPTAVRSFLSKNSYHFEDIRPGVITVRPKFRRSR